MSTAEPDARTQPVASKLRPWGLAHHFESLSQQQDASYFGMWIFLVQEIMFFGGLFTAYIVYRTANPTAFALGSDSLDLTLGAVNTAVLIGSSLTMALAVWAAQTGRRRTIVVFIILTILLGGVFLGIKTVEYGHKWHEHHVPGPSFHWDGPEARGVQMFFNLYFAMTGLHALHMVVGMAILAAVAVWAWRGAFTPGNHNLVEGLGLYWHFVDIVWIFLFPLLYLLGRHAG
ncbi:MAG: cytochrome c oxidase subunit 3 family protein [Acidobacteriota bacterium]|nr:cytochrome c oxidase subunit 3 family protein [Acidobacteriota bacterium]